MKRIPCTIIKMISKDNDRWEARFFPWRIGSNNIKILTRALSNGVRQVKALGYNNSYYGEKGRARMAR